MGDFTKGRVWQSGHKEQSMHLQGTSKPHSLFTIFQLVFMCLQHLIKYLQNWHCSLRILIHTNCVCQV